MAYFEGASQSSRLYLWKSPSVGPKISVQADLATLRKRSRDLVRNSDIASAIVDTWVSNLIGTGINPHWGNINPSLKSKLSEIWRIWCENCDYDNRATFYGLQAIIAREVVEAGECFVVLHREKKTDKYIVPLKLQVIEPELVDELYNDLSANIICGIEFDSKGRRAAYHIFTSHPHDLGFTHERKRIDADMVCHVFRVLRAGQIRGIPWLAPVLTSIKELNEYQYAELVRKKVAAMFGGFIVEGEGAPQIGVPLETGGAESLEKELIALEPGTFATLPPGSDVKFVNPTDVGANYLNWYRTQACKIAKGVGLTYEQMTGDLSSVNYSSIRAGVLEFRRLCKQLQFHIFVKQLCAHIISAWFDVAVMTGIIKIKNYWSEKSRYINVTWHPDGWDWVDPLKDVSAEIKAIRAGLKSRSQVLSTRGYDAEIVDQEQRSDYDRARSLGLLYESVFNDVVMAGSDLMDASILKKEEDKQQEDEDDV